MDVQVMEWKVTHLRYEAFAKDWEHVKQSAVHSSERPVKYDPIKTQERLGREVLFRTAKIDYERVEEFTAKGFLNITELQAFGR